VEWELKPEHVLALLAIHAVLHVLAPQLKHNLVEWKLLTPNGQTLDHLENVLADVAREFKQENVLALLVTLVVPHALVRQLKHNLVERKLLTPNGENLDHGVLVLQNVVWELKLERVLALLVILAVPHVLVRRLKQELVEWKLLIPNGEIMDHLDLVL